ncbi:MAG: hypothetical protein VKM92_07565 [Cyanobacteriota bacterium]|nr:hypothetical protein [Cyanobacteriota bacterium]
MWVLLMPPLSRRFRGMVGATLAALALAATAARPARAAGGADPVAGAGAASLAQLKALQAALNATGPDLGGLLSAGPGLDPALVELRRGVLRKQFPDASWTLTPGPTLKDGRSTVELSVKGSHRQGGSTFRLEASQLLALSSSDGRVNGQAVIREQTILRSGDQELPVSLLIPDVVLTGQRYDIDVVFDEPLNGALVAGGLLALSSRQTTAMEAPRLELDALGGGGLFKTVQAPYTPGEQTWAVLLVHPKGIVSATKRVRVVADRTQLTP